MPSHLAQLTTPCAAHGVSVGRGTGDTDATRKKHIFRIKKFCEYFATTNNFFIRWSRGL